MLLDGSLMNEENNLYLFMGKKVDGKPIIPDGLEDISAFYYNEDDCCLAIIFIAAI